MSSQPGKLVVGSIETRLIIGDITVVIPTLGRPILEESLFWIVSGNTWPGSIVVVDQGQKPEVASWMQLLNNLGIDATYLPSDQSGRAAGVNRGIKQVKTKYFAVTDDDCFVDANWMAAIFKRLEENPGAIVTGRVEAGSEDVILTVTSSETNIQRKPRLKFDSMSGGNMGTSIDVIERVGLLDEDPRLRTAEDGEFAYRVLRAGVPIVYAPEVSVCHVGWREEGARTTQYHDYARSHGGFYGKYIQKGDWYILVRAILHHGRAFRWWMRGLLSGDQEMILLGRAYFTSLLPGILIGLGWKKSS